MKFLTRGKALLAAVLVGTGLMLGGCWEEDNKQPNNQQTTTQSTPAPAAPVQKAEPAQPRKDTPPAIQGTASTKKNVYVVFDGSGSMKDCPPATFGKRDCKPKIVGAKESLVAMATALPDDVNLGLFVFDRRGYREVLQLGPNNKAKFIAAVKAVDADDGTPLGEAIQHGVKVLAAQQEKQLGYGEFRLVVVTDGDATSKSELTKGVNQAAKARVPLFTIGFGIGHDHELRKFSVNYWAADSETQVQQALLEAVSELDLDAPPPR